MKNVAIVGTVGLPACYGGFESLVENLTANAANDISYTVFCSSPQYDYKLDSHNNAKLIYLPIKANGIQSIPYDIMSLIRCLFIKPDVVVILGVSGCIFLPIFKFLSNSKIVTNIDGLEWKRQKWGKWTKRFLKWSEALAVKNSDVVVTDNQAISDYVFEEYSVKSQTIAYGGDHALREVKITPSQERYALGLCRIEPENNVAMILEAFYESGTKIKFVGNWNSSEFGRDLRTKYMDCGNIELLDPIYDLDELYQLRSSCSFYVHGHSAGGTNPSLVEMMHFGMPIFAFDCSFNRYSTENRADYFNSSKELRALFFSFDEDKYRNNSNAMREIANKSYTWINITKSYEDAYLC